MSDFNFDEGRGSPDRSREQMDRFGYDDDYNNRFNNRSFNREDYKDEEDNQYQNNVDPYYNTGGNYLNVRDPANLPYTSFYLMVSGQIQSGTINDHDGICCNFNFTYGKSDWSVIDVSC